jgi:hypothetical protein
MNPLPYPGNQIIDEAVARSLYTDACRTHAIVAWVVMWDLPAYPERYAARQATSGTLLKSGSELLGQRAQE